MKKSVLFAAIAFLAAACTSPTSPTKTPLISQTAFDQGGAVRASAITVERVRLRRSGGGDIVTGLSNGQVVEVPLKEKLDVWAEVRRLEPDRARLVVDWGNGNSDFIGCGVCMLDNIYSAAGRYTLTVRVVDLNAPTEAATLASITVTVVVVDPTPAENRLTCDDVSSGFDGTNYAVAPISLPGFTFTADVFGASGDLTGYIGFEPLNGLFVYGRDESTFTFTSDKNLFTIDMQAQAGIPLTTYVAKDATGKVVASGNVTSTGGDMFYSTAFLRVAGPVFRSVTLKNPMNVINFDNLRAGCR